MKNRRYVYWNRRIKNGKTIIEYTPELDFAVVILSSPEIIKGESYIIKVGSESGEFIAN